MLRRAGEEKREEEHSGSKEGRKVYENASGNILGWVILRCELIWRENA